MENSRFLSPLNIHSSWNNFLNSQNLDLIQNIEQQLQKEEEVSTPKNEWVLRFLEMDVSQIRVIILGQDPYPQEGVATGRSFEVNGLNSWKDKFRNVSLKNMVRAIYSAYRDENRKYSEILSDINEGDRLPLPTDFQILPPNHLFRYWWEEQNVLLLNTAFTCQIGSPNSHTKIWAPFTRNVLEYIAQTNPDITWFLWGNNAQKVVEGIHIVNKIETAHPMMCYQRENDILFGKINPFTATKSLVDWTGFSKS
ncbi:MAG: uracil-DNA glycosylase [Marinifilaceae bacterium]